MNALPTYLNADDLHKVLTAAQARGDFFIIDEKVKAHLQLSSTRIFWIQRPEEQKTVATYERALSFFVHQGLHRDSRLIAIGGGATTDLAGFVAATVLRGVEWTAVPTTLLGMIDAAIGGKVGVNLPEGKNLVGAFHLPREILVCEKFLSTLPEEEWLSGKGEMAKYAFLSQDISRMVLSRRPIGEIAYACARFKAELVARDPKEKGERILLNLGHTLGHAFEKHLGLSHGIAVAMGMKYLLALLGEEGRLKEWEQLITALDLPPEKFKARNLNKDVLIDLLGKDKKRSGEVLRLVVPACLGHSEVREMSFPEFEQLIRSSDVFDHR